MTPVNIVLGRFQPFTLGHLRCVEQAYKETGNKTILCVIETKPEKCDAKHPFSSQDIMGMLEDQIKDTPELLGMCLVSNADIAKIVEKLDANGYVLDSWTCGTDRYAGYSNQCKKYWEKVGLPKEPQVIEVKRGDDDISATKVRQCLMDDDLAGYKKLMPKPWWNHFDELKKMIHKVMENNQEMKPLSSYIMEALSGKAKFTVDDMINAYAWIPNDDMTEKEYTELNYAIQDTFKPRHGEFECCGCSFKYDPKKYSFEVRFMTGNQGNSLQSAIKEISTTFTRFVYSVVGADEDIETFCKDII